MFDVKSFGAKGDNQADDSQPLAAAISAAVKAGGGLVLVSGGVFRTGPLKLFDNIELRVEKNAVLSFIPNFELYPPVFTRWEGVLCWAFHPLIFADGAQGVSLSGGGVLDGAGASWWEHYRAARRSGRQEPETKEEKLLASLNADYRRQPSGGGGRELQFLRPPLIQFLNCRDVKIEGLVLRDSPFWNTHLVFCNDVVIRDVSFSNPANAPNTDGLDIDSSNGVLVEACEFNVGDDCLGLKSGSGEDGVRVGRPTERVSVRACHMRAGHGGVVVGSETAGGVRDISVSACEFQSTDRGLRIKTRRGRGGTVENISLSDCRMSGVICPVVVNCYYGPGGPPSDSLSYSLESQPINSGTPSIRDIRVEALIADNCRASAGFAVGLPENPIQGLFIKDYHATVLPDLDVCQSAMSRGLPKAAGRGFRLRHVVGARISELVVEPKHIQALLIEEGVSLESGKG